MLKAFVLFLWLLAVIAALFVLATEVWEGAPYSVLYFVGTTLLGVIGPAGTRAITKRYPETHWFAWTFLAMTAGIVTCFALLRLAVLLGA